jgi:small membrane protein
MNIQFSQILLLAALMLFVIYIFRLRTEFFDRLVYILCALGGMVLVIDPHFSTQVASLLGIGRGADLIFYLFIIASLFYAVATRSRLPRLEQQLTRLVRQDALEHPLEGRKPE